MTKLTDLSGKVIGRLFVQRRAKDFVQPNGRKRAQWHCICACGNVILVEASNLASAHTRSCGCLVVDTCSDVGCKNRTHSKTDTREWNAWAGAKSRCSNPNVSAFKNYGGRGITMCRRWLNSFAAFFADMGPCPPRFTLERKDVNRGYTPKNCIWASAKTQARNRRTTVYVRRKGRKITLAQAAEDHGLRLSLVRDRFCRQGWSLERSLTTPVRKICV